MSNTLNGINLAKIAQKSLDYLGLQFLPLMALHRDFSDSILASGESVTTRVPTAVTAVDVSGGYTAQAVATTGITITLNKNYGFPYALTDAEIAKAGDLNWLREIFIVPATEAVLKQMMADSLALVTAANFASSRLITAANFDADDCADLAGDLSTNNVMATTRSLLLKPTYKTNVAKDASVQDAAAYGGSEAIRKGMVPEVHGLAVREYNNIPANGEALEGAALHPSALCLAARHQITPVDFPGQIENVIEPVTGLPLQFRLWYSPDNKKTFISVESFYGVSKGNGAALVRIKSA